MTDASRRLLLIDGHSLAYRAFYALPVANFATSSGQPTNAVYGFASMLINLIRDEKPTHIAAAFDVSRKTFRSERFPEYKAQRASTPDEFRSQTGYITELVDALGIQSFAIEGFEADDILATWARSATAEGFEVLICTGDRDSFQLVDQQTTVLYPVKGVTELARMTPEAVAEKYGLSPEQYPDFAALRGDPSDNLPSLPGVGEKTATKWIQQYGSLTALVAHADEITGKVGDSLREHLASVLLNRELTHLRSDVPLRGSLDDLEWQGIKEKEIFALLDHLEIRALRDRVAALTRHGETSPRIEKVASEVRAREVSADELSAIVEAAVGAISLAVELIDDRITAYSVALSESELFLVRDGRRGAWFANPQIKKFLHGAKPLLRTHGLQGVAFDTELAAYLINPGTRNLTIHDLNERFLGESTVTAPTDLFSQFDGEEALVVCKLVPLLEKELAQRGMSSLLLDLEIPVMVDLAEMECFGIGVNQVALGELAEYFRREVERETEAAYDAAGHPFNVGSPKQLQVILFDELKLPKTKKIKTGYTTDAEALEWLHAKSGHPLLAHLLRIREANKLLTTIDGLIAAVAADGRIHTDFQQTVAATGRLSSTNPNLQNIPVRTEEGRRIRDCFVAQAPYTELLTADYSQIEMRIMAHLSKDDKLIAAFASGEDLHSTVASQVFGVNASEVTPQMRRQIKAMSYGLAYGLSAYGLAQQLDLTPPDASALMDSYFQRFGGIRDYLQEVVVEARKVGYTETIMGRRRYLPDLNQENRQRREIAERMALNAPIQGSAADIIKVAMIHCRDAMRSSGLQSRLLLQVHDELIFEVFPGEHDALAELVRREMSSAWKLSVPLEVNIGFGASWDLAAH